jgi:hypothetical protein
MMTAIDILEGVKALLLDPTKWTQAGHMALKEDGEWVDPTSPEATCWCLYGALIKIMMAVIPDRKEYEAIASVVVETLYDVIGSSAVLWNDNPSTKHEDVLYILDKSIEHLRTPQ